MLSVARAAPAPSPQIDPIPIGPDPAVERTSEQQIHFPEVIGSGRGAMWTFSAVGDRPPHRPVHRDPT